MESIQQAQRPLSATFIIRDPLTKSNNPDAKVQKAIGPNPFAHVDKPSVIAESLTLTPSNKRSSYPRITLTRHDEEKPKVNLTVEPKIDCKAGNDNDDDSNTAVTEKAEPPLSVKEVNSLPDDTPSVSDQALAVFRATRTQPPLTPYERLVRLHQEAMKSKDFVLQVRSAIYILNKLAAIQSDPSELATTAVKLIKKHARPHGIVKPGHPDAQFTLGNFYGRGAYGLKVNHDKAFNCYLLASKQYHPECTYRVAVCYEMGIGAKQNSRRALEYFRKSAKMAFVPAMYKLGMILIKSSHVDNRREGISWLKRAIQRTSDQPDPIALHALGDAFETTGYALVPDVEYARQLFTQAADMGYAPSQYRLAVAYETGNLDVPVNQRLAVMWAQKAAFQGIPEAQFLMSCWHLRGTMDGVPQNYDLACRWAKQAAQNGHTRAMFTLACFHEFGIGTEKDRAIAEKWLHAAAVNKDKLAVRKIRELNAASRKDKKGCSIM